MKFLIKKMYYNFKDWWYPDIHYDKELFFHSLMLQLLKFLEFHMYTNNLPLFTAFIPLKGIVNEICYHLVFFCMLPVHVL